MKRLLLLSPVLLLVSCWTQQEAWYEWDDSGELDTDSDSDTDTDADTDADGDTDTDSDSDGDTDTATNESCAGYQEQCSTGEPCCSGLQEMSDWTGASGCVCYNSCALSACTVAQHGTVGSCVGIDGNVGLCMNLVDINPIQPSECDSGYDCTTNSGTTGICALDGSGNYYCFAMCTPGPDTCSPDETCSTAFDPTDWTAGGCVPF